MARFVYSIKPPTISESTGFIPQISRVYVRPKNLRDFFFFGNSFTNFSGRLFMVEISRTEFVSFGTILDFCASNKGVLRLTKSTYILNYN